MNRAILSVLLLAAALMSGTSSLQVHLGPNSNSKAQAFLVEEPAACIVQFTDCSGESSEVPVPTNTIGDITSDTPVQKVTLKSYGCECVLTGFSSVEYDGKYRTVELEKKNCPVKFPFGFQTGLIVCSRNGLIKK